MARPGGSGLFLGVEGGGTRATALAVTIDGTPLARRTGAPGLVLSTEPLARLPALETLIRDVIAEAGGRPPVASLCCALAGVGRAAVRHAVERALERTGLARAVKLVTDAEAALFDAFEEGPGLLLIAGTGSVAWGRGADGGIARAGGWGVHLGDEGSGYAIGLAGLRAVAHAADGRAGATALTPAILEHAATSDPLELIGWADRASKAEVGALAPVVLAAAEGDATARAIVDQAAADLAAHVEALVSRLSPWAVSPRVALAGGLLAPGRTYRATVEAAIRVQVPECVTLPVAVDGARGAASLARAQSATRS